MARLDRTREHRSQLGGHGFGDLAEVNNRVTFAVHFAIERGKRSADVESDVLQGNRQAIGCPFGRYSSSAACRLIVCCHRRSLLLPVIVSGSASAFGDRS
jgi:hypothetical protein